MAKCKSCGGRIGPGREHCASCQASGAAPTRPRCACGRDVFGVLDVCELCWRSKMPCNPDEPIYDALATMDPAGHYVCPGCGGRAVAINTWRSGSYYRCSGCGHTATRPPVEIEPHEGITPEQLLQRFDEDAKKTAAPYAIRQLRKSEGRDERTGKKPDDACPF